eukprot:SAG31_NODE_981_length_10558_cov_2.972273_10_plen_871_part_00
MAASSQNTANEGDDAGDSGSSSRPYAPSCSDLDDGLDADGNACALNSDATACEVATGGCEYDPNSLSPGSGGTTGDHCYGYWAEIGTADNDVGFCGFYSSNISGATKIYNNARAGSVSAVCTTDPANIRRAKCSYIGQRDTNTVTNFCSAAGGNGLVENPESVECAGVRCEQSIDATLCCVPDATCDSVLTDLGEDAYDFCDLNTNGSAVWQKSDTSPRGAGVLPYLVANASAIICGGRNCDGGRDGLTCCQQRTTCSTISDGDTFCDVGLNPDAGHELCATDICEKESVNRDGRTDAAVCCIPRMRCVDWFPDVGCGDGFEGPVQSDMIYCAGSQCEEVDTAICCRPEDPEDSSGGSSNNDDNNEQSESHLGSGGPPSCMDEAIRHCMLASSSPGSSVGHSSDGPGSSEHSSDGPGSSEHSSSEESTCEPACVCDCELPEDAENGVSCDWLNAAVAGCASDCSEVEIAPFREQACGSSGRRMLQEEMSPAACACVAALDASEERYGCDSDAITEFNTYQFGVVPQGGCNTGTLDSGPSPPPSPPPPTYAWIASAFSQCVQTCGPRPAALRVAPAVCVGTTVPAGVQFTASAQLCNGDEPPATSSPCAVLPINSTCDDGNDDTMADMCTSEQSGSCVGLVNLAAKVHLPLDTSSLNLASLENASVAEIDANPIAGAVKTSLAAALTEVEESDITITGISITTARRRRRLQAVNGIAVDYTIALPPATATTVKTASTSMTVPDIVVPAAATTDGVAITVASSDIVAPALKSYSWVKVAATCPTACGTASSTPVDTYSCKEDGVIASDGDCTGAGHAKPSSTTSCPRTLPCLQDSGSSDDDVEVLILSGAFKARATVGLGAALFVMLEFCVG